MSSATPLATVELLQWPGKQAGTCTRLQSLLLPEAHMLACNRALEKLDLGLSDGLGLGKPRTQKESMLRLELHQRSRSGFSLGTPAPR